LAYQFSDIDFFKIDMDSNFQPSAFRGGPGILPSFYFYRKGEEIDVVKGASEKELTAKLQKYSKITDAVSKFKCCCCIPLDVAMIIIGLITVYEFVYNTWYSVILRENEGSWFGIIFWFLFKIAAVGSFIYLALRRNDEKARKINWLAYMSMQIAEVVLICLWFTVAWTTSNYKCTFASNHCIADDLCQSCFLLMYPVAYVLIAIPLKVFFAWTTFRYYRVSKSTAAIRDKLAKKHPYHAMNSSELETLQQTND